MAIYFAKRLGAIISGFFVFSILLFFMGQLTINDSILLKEFNIQDNRGSITSLASNWKLIRTEKRKQNLHLPPFYFSIYSNTSSDTLRYIEDEKIKQTLITLAYHSGSWELANSYFKTIKKELFSPNNTDSEKQLLIHLLHTNTTSNHTAFLAQKIKAPFPQIFKIGTRLLQEKASLFSHLSFTIKWQGSNNSYHKWISGLLSGNMGRSYSYNETVSSKIKKSLIWTVFFSFSSIFLALIIAIPLALLTVNSRLKRLNSFIENLFFVAYAIPSFWMATLLILFLASGTYLLVLPPYGIGYVQEGTSFGTLVSIRTHHLLLPLFCLTYGSIAYLYKQMKEALKNEMSKEYVTTAFSKGLSLRNVVLHHVFRNASFPIITILGGLLPVLISGSFIIENIFAIPGMGKLTLDAFFQRDFPVIFSVLMITYVLTALGLLMADLLYQLNDPRINFRNNK